MEIEKAALARMQTTSNARCVQQSERLTFEERLPDQQRRMYFQWQRQESGGIDFHEFKRMATKASQQPNELNAFDTCPSGKAYLRGERQSFNYPGRQHEKSYESRPAIVEPGKLGNQCRNVRQKL